MLLQRRCCFTVTHEKNEAAPTTTGFQFLQTCLDRKTLLVYCNSPICVLFLCCSKFISPKKVHKYFQRSDENKKVKCGKIGIKFINAVEKYKCARATLS